MDCAFTLLTCPYYVHIQVGTLVQLCDVQGRSQSQSPGRGTFTIRSLITTVLFVDMRIPTASAHSSRESSSYTTCWPSSRRPWRQIHGFLQGIQCQNCTHGTRCTYPNSHHDTTRSLFYVHYKNTSCLIFSQKGGRHRKGDRPARP